VSYSLVQLLLFDGRSLKLTARYACTVSNTRLREVECPLFCAQPHRRPADGIIGSECRPRKTELRQVSPCRFSPASYSSAAYTRTPMKQVRPRGVVWHPASQAHYIKSVADSRHSSINLTAHRLRHFVLRSPEKRGSTRIDPSARRQREYRL
jgi:hypothetical protein